MDTFIGTIQLFPYNFVPQYWAKGEGQLIEISQYQALYSLIGTKFGGDGVRSFGLPNLQGAEPIPGMEYYIALEGLYPPRS